MTNYLLLYSGGGMPETEAEQAVAMKIMKAWEVWYDELGEAVVDWGSPFTPLAKSIASDGSVSDGPVGVMATGYTIIKADSLDEAVEKAKACPGYIGGGDITVYETFQVM
ncbi:MAG TPA: hypothetical protein VM537_00270 [Anaerolineae bacterium]|jgi:hypothetical protein|nr:hypothetical protein [Anaerolineae bacterium]